MARVQKRESNSGDGTNDNHGIDAMLAEDIICIRNERDHGDDRENAQWISARCGSSLLSFCQS